MFTLDESMTVPPFNRLRFMECHREWHTMVAAALFWQSRKCAWLGKHCICMLEVNTQAFYSSNKVDNLCADMPESRAKQDKTTEVEGHKFKPPAKNMCSCITDRKQVPWTHLLQMPDLQKSLLLSSSRHMQCFIHSCLLMSKCKIHSQVCVIYSTRGVTH